MTGDDKSKPPSQSNSYIEYVYDATGVKLEKEVSVSRQLVNKTQYAGNYIYKGPATNTTLQFISQPEGYVEPDGSGGYYYVYQYKDHLGNVRLTYKDSNGNGSVTTSEIIEEKNYFPFGLKHKGYNYIVQGENSAATQFGYNGMENNPELGLEILDFGARYYDAALGRWMNIDPLAETMRRHSPYNFAFNNPVFFIDPDGMSPVSSMMTGNTLTASSIENSAFGNQTFGAQTGLAGGAGLGTGASNGGGGKKTTNTEVFIGHEKNKTQSGKTNNEGTDVVYGNNQSNHIEEGKNGEKTFHQNNTFMTARVDANGSTSTVQIQNVVQVEDKNGNIIFQNTNATEIAISKGLNLGKIKDPVLKEFLTVVQGVQSYRNATGNSVIQDVVSAYKYIRTGLLTASGYGLSKGKVKTPKGLPQKILGLVPLSVAAGLQPAISNPNGITLPIISRTRQHN